MLKHNGIKIKICRYNDKNYIYMQGQNCNENRLICYKQLVMVFSLLSTIKYILLSTSFVNPLLDDADEVVELHWTCSKLLTTAIKNHQQRTILVWFVCETTEQPKFTFLEFNCSRPYRRYTLNKNCSALSYSPIQNNVIFKIS